MSAPQGSGKTTICEELQHLLSHEGYQAVFASLDDFYLTFDAQQNLAKVQSACSDTKIKHHLMSEKYATSFQCPLSCFDCKGMILHRLSVMLIPWV